VNDATLGSYAEVVLTVGLNFKPGRTLLIDAQIEHAPLVRALADRAYAAGATYVDIWYWEPVAKASRLRYAREETLAQVPRWIGQRYEEAIADGCCYVRIAGDPAAGILDAIDPRRVGLDRLPAVTQRNDLQTHMLGEWIVVAYPTAAWAQRVFGDPDVDRLSELLAQFMRLDQRNPAAAWKTHLERLEHRAAQLNRLDLRAIRLDGPGTALQLGLADDHRWCTAAATSQLGVRFVINMPTEEVFTSPRRDAADGVVSASLPLVLAGSVVEGLSLTLAGGRITEVRARRGADTVRGYIATDDGAARLGEIALVDGTSPLSSSGQLFYETLLDENAASHIAWGSGIPQTWAGYDEEKSLPPWLNKSAVHVDFMVGSDEVTVTGIDAAERSHPILDGRRWCLTDD